MSKVHLMVLSDSNVLRNVVKPVEHTPAKAGPKIHDIPS